MTESDIQVIDQVLSGETDAFRHLVERYQVILYDLAFRLTGNSSEAEDIAQEAFIKIYRGLDSYDRKLSFKNWAYTVALNIARNRLKRRSILRFLPLGPFSADDSEGNEYSREIVETGTAPDTCLDVKNIRACLESPIHSLPDELKTAFVLYHLHKNTVNAIAEALSITPNAVNLRIYKARKKLIEKLGH